MGGAVYNTNYGDGRTNVRTLTLTLAVSHRDLAFEACSAHPAPNVFRWKLGAVVWQLSEPESSEAQAKWVSSAIQFFF